MTGFASTSSYWRFAQQVRSRRRYIHSAETRKFLREVLRSAERRIEELPGASYLWRAQKGGNKVQVPIPDTDDTVEEDCPYPTTRMKPLVGQAFEGRANPKGISYLYLATHKDTAVAEVRPWKGGVVSVGQFRLARKLRLVNTSLHSHHYLNVIMKKRRSALEIEEWVWGDIDHAFSEPTQQSDNTSEYVPTQVLAEVFLEAGFDGVGYRSAYGEGHNIVLFDPNIAEQVNCHIVKVKDIKFTLTSSTQFGYEV